LSDIDRSDATAFLGGLPGILSTNKVVVTEGHEKSFDSIFYRWLLDDNTIEIYSGGGCADVSDIVGKSGLWSKISTKIALVGIIDRDFRSDDYMSSLEADGVLPLPFHEAESFLCIPEVISKIGERIGSQEEEITAEKVSEFILSMLEEGKLEIAAKRVFSRAQISLGVSLRKRVVKDSKNKEQLLSHLKEASDGELRKAVQVCNITTLEAYLDEELVSISEAIASKNIDRALYFIPGKELLNLIAPKAGCRNSDDLMRSLKRNFKPEDFAQISVFKEKLGAIINS